MRKILFASLVVGGVSLLTVNAMAHGHGERGWERLDSNGDGAVSAAELDARNAAFLAEADKDGDSLITREEMRVHREARRAALREARDPDKNKDGVVSRTEFIAAAEERFAKLDKNGDGVLTDDEQRRRRHFKSRRGE